MKSPLDKTRDAIRKKYPAFEYTVLDDTPVTPPGKPLEECTLALLTTGGLHLRTDEPFDTQYLKGDCSYRMIPGDVRHEDLAVSHESYDHRYVNADLNCVFPIDRMREYAREGRIGALSERHYSFMGHVLETGPLLENARAVGRLLRTGGVDLAFLTPT